MTVFRSFVLRSIAGCLLAAATLLQTAASHAADVGIVYSATRNDAGFTELAAAGVTRFQNKIGEPIRERVVADYAEALEAIESFASFGLDHVVAVGFIPSKAASEVAGRFPRTEFTLIDSNAEGENIRAIRFREEEVGYLAGVAAALATKTGAVGFVGGVPIPPVERFGCGFVAGATITKPEIRVHAVYIGDDVTAFRDIRRGRDLGARLIEKYGTDVLFPAAGVAGKGTMQAAADNGLLAIGVDTNQNGLFPGTVLTSAIKRVDEAIFRALSDHWEGDWETGASVFGLKERALGLAVDAHNANMIAPFLPTLTVVQAGLTQSFPNAATGQAECDLPLVDME